MSDLFEKLEPPKTAMPGSRARATLKQLLAMWGHADLVHRTGMKGKPEIWTWVSGNGAEALFEKREDGP